MARTPEYNKFVPTVHELRLRHVSQPYGWRSWGGTLARSLYAGVVVGMLSGFVTLLISIVGILGSKILLNRIPFDVSAVYREIAPAVAIAVAVLVFLGNLVWERTHPAPAPLSRT